VHEVGVEEKAEMAAAMSHPPPPVCLLLAAGVLMMLSAACCCCCAAARPSRAVEPLLRVEVDCDHYTPLLSQEAPSVVACDSPLQPLAHEAALKV
jgi:hypothetical protein